MFDCGPLLVAGGAYEGLAGFAELALARRWEGKDVEASSPRRTELVVIPTAASDEVLDRRLTDDKAEWREYGFSAVHVLHTRDRSEADSEAFVAPLLGECVAAVWISGGAQSNLRKAYVGTRVQKALLEVNRGPAQVLVGGSSAGAAIMSRVMIECSDENGEAVVTEGLGLLGEFIIDQHFLKRDRMGRLVKVVQAHPWLTGLGLDEGTAVFANQSTMRVIGASYACSVAVESTLVLHTFAASDDDIATKLRV